MFFPSQFKFKFSKLPTWLMVLFLLIVPVTLIVNPFFSIWAVNTLFGTEIEINFWTWLSAFWLMVIVMHRGSNNE